MKSAVDKALAEGKTLAEILAGVTTDPTLKTEQVEKINSADGYDLPCRGVPAATAVTAIVSVTSANGKQRSIQLRQLLMLLRAAI